MASVCENHLNSPTSRDHSIDLLDPDYLFMVDFAERIYGDITNWGALNAIYKDVPEQRDMHCRNTAWIVVVALKKNGCDGSLDANRV